MTDNGNGDSGACFARFLDVMMYLVPGILRSIPDRANCVQSPKSPDNLTVPPTLFKHLLIRSYHSSPAAHPAASSFSTALLPVLGRLKAACLEQFGARMVPVAESNFVPGWLVEGANRARLRGRFPNKRARRTVYEAYFTKSGKTSALSLIHI